MMIDNSTKQAHSIASKIPDAIWREVFYWRFDDESLHIENKTLSAVTREDLPKNSQQALVLLMIAYELDALTLIEKARNLL
jgi:hypothetical protein